METQPGRALYTRWIIAHAIPQISRLFLDCVQPGAGHTKTAKAARTKPFEGALHVNKPANDNAHTTPPIVTRLRRAGRRSDLANLLGYDRPVQADLYPDNDNHLSRDMGVDSVYEIRPTPARSPERVLIPTISGCGSTLRVPSRTGARPTPTVPLAWIKTAVNSGLKHSSGMPNPKASAGKPALSTRTRTLLTLPPRRRAHSRPRLAMLSVVRRVKTTVGSAQRGG